MEEPQSKFRTFFSQENFDKFKTRCATITKRLFSCCMPLETFTFAFSIFNIVVVTVASIISMVTLVYFGTDAKRIMSRIAVVNKTEPYYYYYERRDHIMFAMISWVVAAISLISLLFAVVLIQGVVKRKPGHVKTYFVYGVIVNLLVFLASIIMRLTARDYYYYDPYDVNVILYKTGFTLWFVYTCVLIAIQKTYQKFQNDLVHQQKVLMDTRAQLTPFSCFSLESGTLVFAIFNMAVTSLVSIASAVGFLYWIIGMIEAGISPLFNQFSDVPELSVYEHCIIYLILLTFALISSAFAGLLLYGILKRNPELLKVYFIYGVVVELLSVLGAILFLQLVYRTKTVQIAVACFILCFIYSGVLFNIYKTYRKIEKSYSYHREHQQLVESNESS